MKHLISPKSNTNTKTFICFQFWLWKTKPGQYDNSVHKILNNFDCFFILPTAISHKTRTRTKVCNRIMNHKWWESKIQPQKSRVNCIYRPLKPLNSNKKKMIGNYWFPRENCGTFTNHHTHQWTLKKILFSNQKRSFSNNFPPLLLPVSAFSTHLLYFISSSKPYMFSKKKKLRVHHAEFTPRPARVPPRKLQIFIVYVNKFSLIMACLSRPFVAFQPREDVEDDRLPPAIAGYMNLSE